MVTGAEYSLQAQSTKYDGLSYEKADCQKFVELVLIDCGVKKPDGKPYDWKGSNSMWRNALSWKGTVQECIEKFNGIPLGAWVFIVKHDGGEVERGYHDNEGNAKHVGIYVGSGNPYGDVRDSTETRTRDGVGYRKLEGFNMVGLPFMLDFTHDATEFPLDFPIMDKVSKEEALKALETLTKYIKGV